MPVEAINHGALLTLLQLASPALPVGAYSYSEGLETLAIHGQLKTAGELYQWLCDELQHGGIRVESAILSWCYEAAAQSDAATMTQWNDWLSAFRETAEMRAQSWQMGRSLLRLFADLEPELAGHFPPTLREGTCHFAIAYGLVAQAWQIPLPAARLAYLHSWASNLVSAAVRAVPLGQTEGQRLLTQLVEPIEHANQTVQQMKVTDLAACSWGVSLASMQHESLYSRLFRS